jgi:hypothetical protein
MAMHTPEHLLVAVGQILCQYTADFANPMN